MMNFKKEIEWLLKEKYHGKATKQFLKDVERLKQGEPLDYVIGFTEFLGCKIDLSKKSLIPRSETEFWVKKAIEKIRLSADFTLSRDFCTGYKNRKPFGAAQGKINSSLFILDIFAGSGCIGIAVLKHCPNVLCDFADIDRNNLEQIKINCALNKIKKNSYKVIKSDIFKGINPSSPRLLRAKYDFVFANPPYVATILRNRIQKSVLKYEPKNALFGGSDGLLYIRKFLKQAKNYLNSRGVILMEFSPEQKKDIEKLILKYEYKNYEFYKDQYNKWRWVVVF